MPAGRVSALIGPSGCGRSTFLRILNRMHELIPSASLAGEVLLDGDDLYARNRRLTDARRQVGMVFQKPNPFPTMSIYDNVVAGLRLTGKRVGAEAKAELVESCLTKAGLWREVRDRLRQPGGALSGGQQQRLCIARSLAIQPRVLLMDEPFAPVRDSRCLLHVVGDDHDGHLRHQLADGLLDPPGGGRVQRRLEPLREEKGDHQEHRQASTKPTAFVAFTGDPPPALWGRTVRIPPR